MSESAKKKLKPVKPENQDSLVATTDKTNHPKMSWDEEKKAMNVFTYSIDDWSKSMGAIDEDMAKMMTAQLVNSIRHGQEADKVFIDGTIAMYRGIEPQDNVECMLTSQMVTCHNMAMECARRAMLADQTHEGIDANVNYVTKLMRTFTAQVETLKRYRTGGKQTIQVQHVNVSEGGQAIVGNIQGGGGNG